MRAVHSYKNFQSFIFLVYINQIINLKILHTYFGVHKRNILFTQTVLLAACCCAAQTENSEGFCDEIFSSNSDSGKLNLSVLKINSCAKRM